MNKDVKLSEERCSRIQASPIMTEAIVNYLQVAHAPSIVTLPHAIRKPVAIEAQNSIFVNVGEGGLVNKVASNDLIVSGLGIVVDVLFSDHWCNLIAVQHFQAFDAANVSLVHWLICFPPIVNVHHNHRATVEP